MNFLSISVVFLVFPPTIILSSCGEGFTEHKEGKTCYRKMSEPLCWADAYKSCQQLGVREGGSPKRIRKKYHKSILFFFIL